MMFVRLIVNKATRKVEHVLSQDVPFDEKLMVETIGVESEIVDLGMLEDHDWTPLKASGSKTASRHIWDRIRELEQVDVAVARKFVHEHPEMPRLHEMACSMSGIREQLRTKGVDGIPTKCRAWLASILPDHHVAALGIGRGLPISAMKAAEAVRNKRDPQSGSRMFALERLAQKQADAHARSRLRKRLAKQEG